MQEDKLLNSLQLNEIKNFIKKNSYWIYNYINAEVLKDIGKMNSNYFIKVIQDIFAKKIDIMINQNNTNPNILPYSILTLLSQRGKLDYTTLRVETINFDQINKEASVYYNYAKFSLKDEFLYIELMQTKIGGMPIDKDIVKFTKIISIKNFGLEEFISKNKRVDTIASNKLFQKIKEAINNSL